MKETVIETTSVVCACDSSGSGEACNKPPTTTEPTKPRYRHLWIVACFVVLSLLISACGQSFSIVGKWKNVGDDVFGQVQKGAIVVFDGQNCNLVSPSDTYGLVQKGQNYQLDCTTMLFSETFSFDLKVVDNDHIRLTKGDTTLELQRVS